MERIFDCVVCVGVHDFKYVYGRLPNNEKEFEDFGEKCKKGVHAQIDWDIIFDCIKEELH